MDENEFRMEEDAASNAPESREVRRPSWPIYVGVVLGALLGLQGTAVVYVPFRHLLSNDRFAPAPIPLLSVGTAFGAMAGALLGDYLRSRTRKK